MSRFLSLSRLLIALPVLAIVASIAVVMMPKDATEGGIEPAKLLATAGAGSRSVGLQSGNVAPDFEISTSDGRRIRLSELRGRPVLVNFWATWCGSCLSEMPEIKALQEEKGLDAFSVLAVNAGEPLSSANKFIDFLQAPFIYGLDPGLVVSDAYDVYGLPVSVFIDSQGIVQANYNGHANRQRLEAYVRAAIEASPPGPFPDSLRMVSTIPRDRVLQVTKREKGRIDFTSRSLRCDSRYCATDAIAALRSAPGVESLKLDPSRAEPSLSLRYKASALTEQQAIGLVVAALEGLKDPLYTQPIEVQ